MHREHPALFGKDEITAAKRLILAKRFVSKEHAELRRKVHRRKRNDYNEDEDEDYRPNHALTTMVSERVSIHLLMQSLIL